MTNNQRFKPSEDSWILNSLLKCFRSERLSQKIADHFLSTGLSNIFFVVLKEAQNEIIADVYALSPRKIFCASLFRSFEKPVIVLIKIRHSLIFPEVNEKLLKPANNIKCIWKRDVLSFWRTEGDTPFACYSPYRWQRFHVLSRYLIHICVAINFHQRSWRRSRR